MTMINATSVTSLQTARTAGASLEGLQRGSRGPDVMELQRQLNARGDQLAVDGVFGPKTEAALKRLQANCGVETSGRVDQATAEALLGPASPDAAASPAVTTPTVRASTEVQQGARARTVGAEATARAALEQRVPTTPATTGPTRSAETLSPEELRTARAGISLGRRQLSEEHAVLQAARSAVEREIDGLEQRPRLNAGDRTVLEGRKAQLEVITQAEGLLRQRGDALDARERALKDGVLTPAERDAFAATTGELARRQASLDDESRIASSTVSRGLAGRRSAVVGDDTRGATAPEPTSTTRPTAGSTSATPQPGRVAPPRNKRAQSGPSTPSATPATSAPAVGLPVSRASVEAANARIDQALAGTQAEKEILASMQASIQAEVRALRRLPNRSAADQAVLQGREAQLQTIDQASRHLDVRADGLRAAKRAFADGILTAGEASRLAVADAALSQAEQQLAALWNAATSLVQQGLNVGGRGTSQNLQTY
jgi:peptidoglycan hydrolase-like protein with peptidoglycan-binding domain